MPLIPVAWIGLSILLKLLPVTAGEPPNWNCNDPTLAASQGTCKSISDDTSEWLSSSGDVHVEDKDFYEGDIFAQFHPAPCCSMNSKKVEVAGKMVRGSGAVCAQSNGEGDRQHHPYMTNTDTGTVFRGEMSRTSIIEV